MIEIRKVTKKFNNGANTTVAVNEVNLNIDDEIFGIIGLSGAGKSTLLRMINRLEEPTSGSISINGNEVTTMGKQELKLFRRNIGMIFQHFNLLESRTVAGNIAFPLEIAGVDKVSISKRVNELLDLVELKGRGDSYISELSGGQKQRVAIARALANNPNILLCDEATSALDPKTTRVILNLLKNIKDKLGITIILITHEMEVIREICDRVAIMENGEVIEMGNVSDVFSRPKTDTAKAFITNLSHEGLEESIIKRYADMKLVKLSFLGEGVDQPIVYKLIKDYDLELNILSGNIEFLQRDNVGSLIAEIKGNQDNIDNAIAWLGSINVKMEVINNG